MGTTKARKASAAQVELKMLSVDAITVEDGFNPRTSMDAERLDALGDSMLEHGLLNPVVARFTRGKPKLIGGHRRVAAARAKGIKEIPVLVRKTDTDELVEAVVDNAHRDDLTPLEEALAFGRLKADGWTVDGIARSLSVPKRRVTERLRILDLPTVAQEALGAGTVGPRHVNTIAAIAEKSMKLAAALTTAAVEHNDARYLTHQRSIETVVEKMDGGVIDPGSFTVGSNEFKLATPELKKAHAKAVKHLKGWNDDRYAFEAGVRTVGRPFDTRGYSGEPRLEGRLQFDDPAVAEGVASGSLIEIPAKIGHSHDEDGLLLYCVDQKWLQETYAPRFLDGVKAGLAEVTKRKSRMTGIKPPEGSDEAAALQHVQAREKEQRAREREGNERKMYAAREFNDQLGQALLKNLSVIDLAKHPQIVDVLMQMAVAPDRNDDAMHSRQITGFDLAANGLRFILGWHNEETRKSGKVIRRYIIDRGELEKRWAQWYGEAKTSEQKIGKLVIAMAACCFAKTEAAETKGEAYYTTVSPFRKDHRQAIEKVAAKHVPGSRPPRAPRQKSGPTSGPVGTPGAAILAKTLTPEQRAVFLARTHPQFAHGGDAKPLKWVYEQCPQFTNKEVDTALRALDATLGLLKGPKAGGYIVTGLGEKVAKVLREQKANGTPKA